MRILFTHERFLPDFGGLDKWHRVGALGVIVGGGAVVYAMALLALGLRPRDLRGH